jgi:carbonic anhydrase/acetyltransferase-like protein (isoleucine patch superfamily)
VIGDVELGEETSVWFTSVLRGDVNFIRVGRGTNIQDGTIVHGNRRGTPTVLEDFVTVGHAARLHCLMHRRHHPRRRRAGRGVLGGSGGGDLARHPVPRGSVLMGAPARVKRQVTLADLDLIQRSAEGYIALRGEYLTAQGPSRT